MDVSMIVLRLIHIFSGVLWVGWAFLYVAFLQPAIKAAGPDGGKFMQILTGKTRLTQVLFAASTLNILSGIAMYWRVSGGFSVSWITSGVGIGLTVGALAALAAFAIGSIVSRPAVERMSVLGRELQAAGRPPTPEQLAEMKELQEKLSKAGVQIAVLLGIALAGMATARYLWF